MSYLVEQPPHCDLLRLSLPTGRFVRFGRTHLPRSRNPGSALSQRRSRFEQRLSRPQRLSLDSGVAGPRACLRCPLPACPRCQKLSLSASSRRWKTRAFLFRQSSISSLWPQHFVKFLTQKNFQPSPAPSRFPTRLGARWHISLL